MREKTLCYLSLYSWLLSQCPVLKKRMVCSHDTDQHQTITKMPRVWLVSGLQQPTHYTQGGILTPGKLGGMEPLRLILHMATDSEVTGL